MKFVAVFSKEGYSAKIAFELDCSDCASEYEANFMAEDFARQLSSWHFCYIEESEYE